MTHLMRTLPDQSYKFDGERIAGPVDNRKSDSGWMRPRWLYLRLLRSDGGMYFVERIAHSVVAHEVDAPCVAKGKASERGLVVPVTMLPDDAVACAAVAGAGRRRCHPGPTPGEVPR